MGYMWHYFSQSLSGVQTSEPIQSFSSLPDRSPRRCRSLGKFHLGLLRFRTARASFRRAKNAASLLRSVDADEVIFLKMIAER
ncbi:hypothetical protein OROGR_018011 [Orobanche gracilis]